MNAASKHRMGEAEYLAWEAAQPERHEWVNGEVLAMSGASAAHALATANLLAWLHGALQGSGCRPLSADLRVRIDETGLYAYPDLSVVCGRPELSDTNPPSLLNPRVVVEVLSPSTEAYDRGAKAAHYRQRASIQAIVFVATEEHRVEVHFRNADGTWTLAEARDGELALPPLAVRLPIAAVYDGFDLLS